MLRDTYRDSPWSAVHADWQDGYLRFLDLAEQIPEDGLFDTQRYGWMHGYSLYAVLEGAYIHHHDEHFEPLQRFLRHRS